MTTALIHPPTSAPARARRLHGVILRDLYHLRRNPPLVFEVAFWPTFELITWGCVSLFLQAHRVPAILAGLLGAVLLWQVLARLQGDLVRSFLEELWSRNMLNIHVTPLSTGEFLAGLVASALLRMLTGLAVLATMAYGLYGFGLFSLGPALVPYMAILIVMGWSVAVLAMALVTRFGQSAQTFAFLLAFVFQPFAAVFYPLAVLPGPVQAIAHAVPASYVFEGMRAALAGRPAAPGGLVIAGVLDLVYAAAAVWCLHRSLRYARATGRLARMGH